MGKYLAREVLIVFSRIIVPQKRNVQKRLKTSENTRKCYNVRKRQKKRAKIDRPKIGPKQAQFSSYFPALLWKRSRGGCAAASAAATAAAAAAAAPRPAAAARPRRAPPSKLVARVPHFKKN